MKEAPHVKYLVARYCWRPLGQVLWFAIRPQLLAYAWLVRPPQPVRQIPLIYYLDAACVALIEPFAKWHAVARQRMKEKTDSRQHPHDKPANRNGEHKRDDHEQR